MKTRHFLQRKSTSFSLWDPPYKYLFILDENSWNMNGATQVLELLKEFTNENRIRHGQNNRFSLRMVFFFF